MHEHCAHTTDGTGHEPDHPGPAHRTSRTSRTTRTSPRLHGRHRVTGPASALDGMRSLPAAVDAVPGGRRGIQVGHGWLLCAYGHPSGSAGSSTLRIGTDRARMPPRDRTATSYWPVRVPFAHGRVSELSQEPAQSVRIWPVSQPSRGPMRIPRTLQDINPNVSDRAEPLSVGLGTSPSGGRDDPSRGVLAAPRLRPGRENGRDLAPPGDLYVHIGTVWTGV